MMLTKEECENALDILKEQYEYLKSMMRANYPFTIEMIENSYKCFEQLYKEHFNLIENFKQLEKNYDDLYDEVHNPKPLKFEELEEDMVVWDNKSEMFIKISEVATLEENCFSFEIFGWEVPIYDEQFEENRFYRKQVE